MIYAVIDTNVLVAAVKTTKPNNVKHFSKVTRVVTPSEMLMLLHESGEI